MNVSIYEANQCNKKYMLSKFSFTLVTTRKNLLALLNSRKKQDKLVVGGRAFLEKILMLGPRYIVSSRQLNEKTTGNTKMGGENLEIDRNMQNSAKEERISYFNMK